MAPRCLTPRRSARAASSSVWSEVNPPFVSRRIGELAAAGQQQAQVELSVGVAALVGSAIRRECAFEVSLSFQQHPEVGSGAGIASLVGPPERGQGTWDVTYLGEQAAEVERAVHIAMLVGPPVSGKRTFDVTLLLEQNAEVRGALRVPGGVGLSAGSQRAFDIGWRGGQYLLESRDLSRSLSAIAEAVVSGAWIGVTLDSSGGFLASHPVAISVPRGRRLLTPNLLRRLRSGIGHIAGVGPNPCRIPP
jgi:hypothetical protein